MITMWEDVKDYLEDIQPAMDRASWRVTVFGYLLYGATLVIGFIIGHSVAKHSK